MKDLLARFRFGDFTAYFLPGLVMLGAVASLLALGGVASMATNLHTLNVAEILAIACAAYISGAVISGSSYRLIAPVFAGTRFRRYVDPRLTIEPRELSEPVTAALAELLGTRLVHSWSEDHFYLARTAVHERLPQTSAEAMRQNDLMRLRENMLTPLLAWSSAGLWYSYITYQHAHTTGITLGVSTVALSYVIAGRIACRSVDNRRREVREICVGFLIAHRLGLFNNSAVLQRELSGASSPTAPNPDSVRLPVSGPVAGDM